MQLQRLGTPEPKVLNVFVMIGPQLFVTAYKVYIHDPAFSAQLAAGRVDWGLFWADSLSNLCVNSAERTPGT